MGAVLLILLVALVNLALGAVIAIALGKTPPLGEIVDGILYGPASYDAPEDGPGQNDVAAVAATRNRAATDDAGGPPDAVDAA